MYTIGILLKDVDVSQKNWQLISQLNQLNLKSNNNYCVFYMNPSPLCVNNFCSIDTIHNIHKVGKGILIATDLDTALILQKSQTKARKIYYVWDLEFVHNKNSNYLFNLNILKSLDLWTRSGSYSDVIKNYCNIKPNVSTKIEDIINAY